MKRHDGDKKKGCGLGTCLGIVVGLFVLLFLAQVVFMMVIPWLSPAPSNEDGSPMRAEALDWITSVYIDDVRYLAADIDRDGQVDCFYTVGGQPFTRAFRAAEFDGRCTRNFLGPRALPGDLRDTLTELLAVKFDLGASHEIPEDLDGDGIVDCVRRRPGATALLSYDDARCEKDEWTEPGDPADRTTWDEVLRLNEAVRRSLPSPGS